MKYIFSFFLVLFFYANTSAQSYVRYGFCESGNTIPKFGESSAAVRELQTFLRSHYSFKLASTGYFGNQTRNAIKTLQISAGLSETGVINIATLTILRQDARCNGNTIDIKKIIKRLIEKGEDIRFTQSVNETTNQQGSTTHVSVYVANQNQNTVHAYATQTPIASPTQVQNDLITKLLKEQEEQKGINVLDPLRNLNPNDNQFGLFFYAATPTKSEYLRIQSEINSNNNSRYLLDLIHNKFIFTKDVYVIFKECNEENAFFESSTDSIVMCYEYVQKKLNLISATSTPYVERLEQAFGYVLFHELGHALVFYYDLPITGKEESAVDEFAAYMFYKIGDQQSINNLFEHLNAHFASAIEQSTYDVEDFAYLHADEHDLSIIRYYDLLKFLVGLFPSMRTDPLWIGNNPGQLPQRELYWAEKNAERKLKVWDKLLEGKIRR